MANNFLRDYFNGVYGNYRVITDKKNVYSNFNRTVDGYDNMITMKYLYNNFTNLSKINGIVTHIRLEFILRDWVSFSVDDLGYLSETASTSNGVGALNNPNGITLVIGTFNPIVNNVSDSAKKLVKVIVNEIASDNMLFQKFEISDIEEGTITLISPSNVGKYRYKDSSINSPESLAYNIDMNIRDRVNSLTDSWNRISKIDWNQEFMNFSENRF